MRPEPGPVRAVWRTPALARPTDALAEVDPPAHHGALVRVVGGAAMLTMRGVGLVLDAIDLVAWSIEVVLSVVSYPLRWWHHRR